MVEEHDDQIGRFRVGKLLKAVRTEQGLSQRDIAISMGYNNANFISMIESGTSRPPADKTAVVGPAFKMPPIFTAALLKQCDTPAWKLCMDIIKALPENIDVRDVKAVEKAVDKWFNKALKDHNIAVK